ncbi:MAG: hypothetical protein JXA93_01285 [Anaerolineae bacterium]|nr:hypothetical protein [Anaerolineae bacterium]
MLLSITFLVNLVVLAVGLWLGLYVVTRSPRRLISWLTGLTLWSLSGHFLNVLLALAPPPTPEGAPAWLNPLLQFWAGSAAGGSNAWLQTWAFVPAVILWHHATSLMRSPQLSFWRRALLVAGYAGTISAAVIHVNTPLLLAASPTGDPLYLSSLKAGALYPLVLALGLVYTAISLANLVACARAPVAPILRKQFLTLVLATLLASSVALLSVAGSSLGLRVPMVATSVPLGAAMALVGYGVARYSALAEGRTIGRDFYHAAIATGLTSGCYLFLAWLGVRHFGVPPMAYAFTVILAVTTHFLVDAARYQWDASLGRQDLRQVQTSLHRLAVLAGDREELDHALSATLELLCACAQAIFGLILVFEDGQTRLAAAHGWTEEHPQLSIQDLSADDVLHLQHGHFPPPLAEAALLIPLYGGAEQLGALLLGRPVNGAGYAPADVDQFLYPSDRLGDIIWNARRRAEYMTEVARGAGTLPPEAVRYPEHVSVEAVEDALRHMADYGYLGEHSLARSRLAKARIAASTVTHIDLGKAVYGLLADAIEKLRPGIAPTADPPPREWYPYLILHDAYLEGTSNRDIMSRLYISHGTFSRTRRAALRAVARALEEMEAGVD